MHSSVKNDFIEQGPVLSAWERRGKKLFGIDLGILAKISLCYLFDIFNIQRSTAFLREPRSNREGKDYFHYEVVCFFLSPQTLVNIL